MQKIIFDNVIFSLQRAGGISVVWYELLKRIVYTKHKISFLEYKKNTNNLFRNQLNIPFDKVIYRKGFLLCIKRYFNIQIKFSEKFIFHSSYYRTCKNRNAINVTTVHDFTYEYFSIGLKRKIHSWQKFKAIRNSDVIICVSENTKKDLIKFIPNIDVRKLRVIYNGISDDFFSIDNKGNYVQLPFCKESYILFVGSRAKYKNFELVVNAVSKSLYNLVIVGSTLSRKENLFVNSVLKQSKVKYIGYVSNQQLNILYNNAFCLLYPSSYEGFGIPVLEAQKAGCPVVAYKGSSIPEIIGTTPLLINSLCIEQILDCFKILTNSQKRLEIINNGLKNAERFSWDQMYKEVMGIYNIMWNSKKS